MKRVLVTGGTGFVGRRALRLLNGLGYEVHAISHTTPPDVDAGVRWRRADLLNPRAVTELVRDVRPTHLLHFAWYAVPGEFWHSKVNLRWRDASTELLREFAACGGERAAVAGTCAEYDWQHGLCSETQTPLAPSTLYGVCKRAVHAAAEELAAESDLSLAWGRIFFVYGPGEHPARLVPSVVGSLLRGEPARCTHGRQLRDFLHVADVASAFVRLLDSGVEGSVNVASGVPVSIGDVVGAIAEVVGRPDLVRLGELPVSPDEPLELVADTRRLRDEVEWSQAIDLRHGLADTIEWWRRALGSELGAAA